MVIPRPENEDVVVVEAAAEDVDVEQSARGRVKK